jgi:two-component system OmpR family sensor kinase
MGELEQTRHRLLWVLGLGTLGALAAVGLVGAWLVRLGLAPLTAVEHAASDVTGTDLDRRVPGGSEATEVGRLALAINTMLDRLDVSFRQRERDVEALQVSEARMRRFVADASHELRTPIAATAAYAELFERGAKDRPDDLARAMAGIRTETGRMADLVDDLLLLAELDEGRPVQRVPVDLTELAAEAVQAAHVVAPDRPVALHVHDVVVVAGDPGRLRQVLDNLIGNVRAHTPAGTPSSVTLTRDDGGAVLTVLDEGPGLAAEDLAKVTDRFFRADTSRSRTSGGAGLGLAIVSAIAHAHGGVATIDSPEGHGLRVTVRLPEAADPSPGGGPT